MTVFKKKKVISIVRLYPCLDPPLVVHSKYSFLLISTLDPFKNVSITGACVGKGKIIVNDNAKLHWEANENLTSIWKPNDLNTTHFRLTTNLDTNRMISLVRDFLISISMNASDVLYLEEHPG